MVALRCANGSQVALQSHLRACTHTHTLKNKGCSIKGRCRDCHANHMGYVQTEPPTAAKWALTYAKLVDELAQSTKQKNELAKELAKSTKLAAKLIAQCALRDQNILGNI